MSVAEWFSKRWSPAIPATALLLAVAMLVLVAATPVAAAKKDVAPPEFAGLKSATTCTPGPVGGTTTTYHLTWDPAQDNKTPANQIVYDVYQATSPGGEDFSVPTYTSPAGATSFDTPSLPAETTFSFVVRARDRAGNRDSNKVERQGQNPCV